MAEGERKVRAGRAAAVTPEPAGQGHGETRRPDWADHGLLAYAGPVFRLAVSATESAQIVQSAAEGVRTPAGPLPHAEDVQRAFGRHDVSHVQAHVGAEAAASARAMGAQAYATGQHVVFGAAPDIRTTAHEAAHVVQQRAGVQLPGGVGQAGDAYERHADAVADRVSAGQSAEELLDRFAGGAGPGGAVQRMLIDQPGGMGSAVQQIGLGWLKGLLPTWLGGTPASEEQVNAQPAAAPAAALAAAAGGGPAAAPAPASRNARRRQARKARRAAAAGDEAAAAPVAAHAAPADDEVAAAPVAAHAAPADDEVAAAPVAAHAAPADDEVAAAPVAAHAAPAGDEAAAAPADQAAEEGWQEAGPRDPRVLTSDRYNIGRAIRTIGDGSRPGIREYHNREGYLPDGRYDEYHVGRGPNDSAGERRIIANRNGLRLYYTNGGTHRRSPFEIFDFSGASHGVIR